MKKGILSQSNYTLVNKSVLKAKVGGNLSINSTVPEHGFRKGEVLNSTEAGSTRLGTPKTQNLPLLF